MTRTDRLSTDAIAQRIAHRAEVRDVIAAMVERRKTLGLAEYQAAHGMIR